MRLALLFASALTLAVAAGCSTESRVDEAPGPVAFAPEAEASGALVYLRGRPSGDRLVVEVVARGASDIHGAAFRLRWDPEALAFVEATAGHAWSKQAVALAKEGTPGQLAIVWSEKGEGQGITSSGETVLGTLAFDVRGRKGSALSFGAERSALVDSKGSRVAVAWRGGSVPER